MAKLSNIETDASSKLLAMSTEVKVNGVAIARLTEENYSEWIVDIRAILRQHDLWSYVQATSDIKATTAQLEKAADLMTLTLSKGVKQKLSDAEFNDGQAMLKKLESMLQPIGETQFMRCTREYYSLKYDESYKASTSSSRESKFSKNALTAPKSRLITTNELSFASPWLYQRGTDLWYRYGRLQRT